MVRDVLTGNDVAWNTFQNEDVGVAIDKADDAEISVADEQADKALMLVFSAATATITKAGFRGDLDEPTGGAQEVLCGPFRRVLRFRIQ